MRKDESKKKSLSEDEYFILDVLRYLGAEGNDVLGPLLLLNKDKENKLDNVKKLRKYIEFKGKYITQQDILEKSLQITTPREQYYPCEMYVRYIGKSTDKLFNNRIYRVNMVFGIDEYYLIEYKDNHLCEFYSGLFEIQKVTELKYIGSKNEDGTNRITDGFVVGEKYKVISFQTGKYICQNGLECMLDEIEPVGFQAKEPRQPVPFNCVDDALKAIIRAFEFGRVHQLSIHIHPECVYISQTGEKEFYTKRDIVKHLQKISAAQLESDMFIDCALATITESQETNKFSVDDRCFAIYEESGCKGVVFVNLSDDNRYITGIYILNEVYKFKLDED